MGANNDPVYRILRIFFFTLALLLCGFCSWVYGWFEFLYYKERQAYPRWDAVNTAIIVELRPPEGVREIERETSGGVNRHGRWLYVFYEYDAQRLKREDIEAYYNHLLRTNEWSLFDQNESKDTQIFGYFRGASCIEFSYYSFAPKYAMYVWQDYSAYPYSPQLPPEWLLNIFDTWEGEIATCPPE